LKNCVFVSAGDNERFASYAIDKLSNRYDIIVNHYGDDLEKRSRLTEGSTALVTMKMTKFMSLKRCYDRLIKGRYEWVAVFDDDAMFTSGSLDELIDIGTRYDLDIVSPVHDTSGRVSHRLHLKCEGDQKLRLVNFVEMNYPVFRNRSLEKYMDAYDGELCGWGNDWWYCNVLGTDTRLNAGVVDSVSVENPSVNGEMDSFLRVDKRMDQWEETKAKYSIREWDPRTVGYIWDS
jgi:hypothetical protein